jgi:3-keto-5-aminohexanoate cleavage enzyme
MVMCAPNGARRTHADHPALPVSAEELAYCAVKLRDSGVSVMHLHVRDEQGRHSLDADAYRTAIDRIRETIGSDLVLQVTTEAVGRYAPDEQKALVRELRPEAVSLALRELCPDEEGESSAAAFFEWLVNEGIWPQYILHSAEDMQRFESLRRRGMFANDNPSCLLVLGRYPTRRMGDPAEIAAFLSIVDVNYCSWTVCCFGPHEHQAMLAAHAEGGHVRIGFENNLVLADGSPAADNAALVVQFTAAIERSARRPATADEVRETFMFR